PALAVADADRAPALEEDFLAQSIGDDAQVGPLHRRAQMADRGRTASALASGGLVVADAVLGGAIEIVVAGEAELGRALDEGFADRVVLDIGNAERAATAVKLVGAADLMLGALEIGQHVFERPPGTAELAPVVEILGLAADVDHAVDRGGAAEHLAAGPVDAPVAGPRIGLGLVAPVDAGIGESLAEAERNMDPAVLVLAAGLQQHDPGMRVLAEPGRHRAAR